MRTGSGAYELNKTQLVVFFAYRTQSLNRSRIINMQHTL